MYHCDAGLLFILERFYKDAVNSQQQRDDGGDSAHKGPHSDRAGGGGGGDAHNYDPTASLHDMTAMVTDVLADYFLAAMAFDDAVHLCKRESNREARANPELWRRVLTHLVLRCELRNLGPVQRVISKRPLGFSVNVRKRPDFVVHHVLVHFVALADHKQVGGP